MFEGSKGDRREVGMRKRLTVIGVVAAGVVVADAWHRSSTLLREPLVDERARDPEPDSQPASPDERAEISVEPTLEPEPARFEPTPEPILAAAEPVAVEESSDTAADGARLEWMLTTVVPEKRPRRRTRLPVALARTQPHVAVGGAVLLLNVLAVAGLATMNGLDDVGNWVSRWVSILF
jgi:hypothetical protein